MEKALRTTEHQLSAQDSEGAPPVFTWLRDVLGSPPRYSLLQTLLQPLPEPSMETPTPFPALVHQPALICWLRGPTTNVAGTGCGQAPHPGERSPPLGKPDGPQPKANWAIPDTRDSLPDPQGPRPGHTQLAWQPGTEALSCPGLRSQFPKVHLLGLGTQGWAHSLQQPEGLCQVLGSRLGARCPGGLGGPEGIPHPGSGG